MKSNYLNKTKNGLKALMAGFLLMGVTSAKAQCVANYTFVPGPNGSVTFMSNSSGTTASTAYWWNFGGSNVLGSINQTHTYTTNGYKTVCLTIMSNTTSPSSCSATVCDSVLITNATSSINCIANFNFTLGNNGLVNLSSTSTGTTASTNYLWNFGGPTATGNTATRTYTSNGPKVICLNITNSALGCSSTKCDTVWITNVPASTVTPCAPSVVYSLSKDSTQALTWNAYPFYPSNITNATWYWGDGSSTTGLYPSHTYSAAGTYSTCVTISVSCGTVTATYCYVASIFRSSQSNAMVTLNVKQSGATGISRQSKEANLLTIYPNPNNGEFVLELKGTELKENTISIYNLMGQKVAEKQILVNDKQTIDAGNLPNGTYLVKINSESGSVHKKITIQK